MSFLFAGCGAAPINRAKIAKTQTPVSELKNELPQQTAKIAQNSPKRTQKILEAKDPESTELVFAEAYESMTRGEWQNGITLFDDALKSGFLNDGARAIAYWNLYYAHNQLKRDDACLEAISSFIVVAEELLYPVDSSRLTQEVYRDFIESFNLKRRLERARAKIAAAWSERSNDYGRSRDYPIRIRSDMEKIYFIGFAQPCSTGPLEFVKTRSLGLSNDAHLERVEVHCRHDKNQKIPKYFFFEVALK
ncbi:hypothetical protein KAI87_15495 [Myxococcota bacterium]|nr:hypothetical protein [Myxococcota bacterium]